MPMYKVKPVSGGEIKVDLPTCMYKLPNIHAQHGIGCGEHALQNGGEDPVLKELEARQDKIMQKLSLMKAEVDGMAKTYLCNKDTLLSENGEVDPAVRALEARQDEIMRKLYELKATVDGLAKTVETPDADLDTSTLIRSPAASTFTGTADLDALLGKDQGALRDIVINANPASPPLSLLVLHGLLSQRYRVLSSVHLHSSITSVPLHLLSVLGPSPAHSYARHRFQLGFTLIWKDVPKLQMKFSTQSMCTIEGEGNVARFLFRLLGGEPQDPALATQMDAWVDTAFFQLAEGGNKERAVVLRSLNSELGRSAWLLGQELSLADIACACCLLRTGQVTSAPANVQRWLQSCRNLGHFDCVYPLLQ